MNPRSALHKLTHLHTINHKSKRNEKLKGNKIIEITAIIETLSVCLLLLVKLSAAYSRYHKDASSTLLTNTYFAQST